VWDDRTTLTPSQWVMARRLARSGETSKSALVALHGDVSRLGQGGCLPEKRKVGSSTLPLTTRSVPFWPGQTLTLELWVRGVSDRCIPLLAADARTLSHVDRTPLLARG
jgi:hypothetical protein